MTKQDEDKLKKFDAALKEATTPKEVRQKSDHNQAMGNAYKYATELLAGFVIGAIMGWSIDNWLQTKPLFMIVFIFVGAAAGILNVVKSSKRDFEAQQKAQENAKNGEQDIALNGKEN